MATASKTLSQALAELIEQLEVSNSATISNLAKSLAENLPRNYSPYLFPGKKLTFSAEKQKINGLYSATYVLVDDLETQRKGA